MVNESKLISEVPLGLNDNDVNESMNDLVQDEDELINYEEEVSLNKESMYALMQSSIRSKSLENTCQFAKPKDYEDEVTYKSKRKSTNTRKKKSSKKQNASKKC